MNTVTIGTTTKGRRVWLQGIAAHMPDPVSRYDVVYEEHAIVVAFRATGKRKVTMAKGGIIDLVGAQVTQWAQEATNAIVAYGIHTIIITRATA